jgi:hypothetical protein
MLVKISDGTPVAHPYTDEQGNQYQPNIEDIWSDAELAAIGIRRMTQAEKDAANLLILPQLVRQEAMRRIKLIVDADTLTYLIAFHLANILSASEKTALGAGAGWLRDMRAAAKTLVQNGDLQYALDAKWPAVPATFTAVVATYSV